MQVNAPSHGGNCLFTALGNAFHSTVDEGNLLGATFTNEDSFATRRRPRNLQAWVRAKIVKVLEERDVEHAMMNGRGYWMTETIKTIDDYKEFHLGPAGSERDRWGTTSDVHLFALGLSRFHNIENRIVVCTKTTNEYKIHHPLTINKSNVIVLGQTTLDPSEVLTTDIVVVNTGNHHWTHGELTHGS